MSNESKPNGLKEHKSINVFFASKSKGCLHTNEVEEDPNGSLERSKAKTQAKVKREGERARKKSKKPYLLGEKLDNAFNDEFMSRYKNKAL
jgi:hypothetical protein